MNQHSFYFIVIAINFIQLPVRLSSPTYFIICVLFFTMFVDYLNMPFSYISRDYVGSYSTTIIVNNIIVLIMFYIFLVLF